MSKKPPTSSERKRGSGRSQGRADDVEPSLLPSRADILAALRDAGIPLPAAELARAMGVDRRARAAFQGRIEAMQRDGELLANRKGELCVVAKLDLVTGTVQGHPDGFGFLVPDDGGPDLFLDPREMHKVLHGDRATARRTGTDRRGRPEGEIVDVLVRANRTIVGRLHEERGIAFVVAENRRINQDLLVPPGERGAAKAGRRRRRRDRRAADARSARRSPAWSKCSAATPIRAWRSRSRCASTTCRMRSRPPPSARRTGCRAEVRAADRKGRIDLTALPLVTIDGETAKDFDDAVYCERTARGFRLIVAIADVSHYVRDGDALDRDARERGTSVYFPRRVIPMLPEALSNELCSLKPAVDRLCMACEMDIDAQGAIADYRFYPAVDALSRAPDLHAGLGRAFAAEEGATRDQGGAAAAPGPLRALSRAQGGARGARARSISTRRRCSSSSTSAGRSSASCPSSATTRTS